MAFLSSTQGSFEGLRGGGCPTASGTPHADPPLISSAPSQPCHRVSENLGNVQEASCGCLLARSWVRCAAMPAGAGVGKRTRPGRATAWAGEVLAAPAPSFASAAGGSPKLPTPHSLLPVPTPAQRQAATCQRERCGSAVSTPAAAGTGRPRFPQLPRGSSTAACPTLSLGKGLPSSLSILRACDGCQRIQAAACSPAALPM